MWGLWTLLAMRRGQGAAATAPGQGGAGVSTGCQQDLIPGAWGARMQPIGLAALRLQCRWELVVQQRLGPHDGCRGAAGAERNTVLRRVSGLGRRADALCVRSKSMEAPGGPCKSPCRKAWRACAFPSSLLLLTQLLSSDLAALTCKTSTLQCNKGCHRHCRHATALLTARSGRCCAAVWQLTTGGWSANRVGGQQPLELRPAHNGGAANNCRQREQAQFGAGK